MKVVFLSYLNRSGSTYLINQLSKIPEFAVCPEADILYDLLLMSPNEILNRNSTATIIRKLQNDKKFSNWNLEMTRLICYEGSKIGLFLLILTEYRNTYVPNADKVVFKYNWLLNSFCHLKHNKNMYWIALIRNPFATYASQKVTVSPHTGEVMSRNPLSFIDSWNKLYRLATTNIGSNKISLLIFQSLIEDLDRTMDGLLKFVGSSVKWELYKHREGKVYDCLNEQYREIHSNINSKPKPEVLDKWKLVLTPFEILIINKYMTENHILAKEDSLGNISYLRVARLRIARKLIWIKSFIRKQLIKYA